MKTTASLAIAAAVVLSPAIPLTRADVTERMDSIEGCYTIDGEVVCPPEDHSTVRQAPQGAGAASPEPLNVPSGSETMPGDDGTSGAP
jgi:hypothetical protein